MSGRIIRNQRIALCYELNICVPPQIHMLKKKFKGLFSQSHSVGYEKRQDSNTALSKHTDHTLQFFHLNSS